MRTSLCEQLGIEFPIFAFTHCRDVVAAVSNAGGLGVLGAVGFSPEQLEVECKWIDERIGDKQYGVDLVIPQKYEGMGELDPEKLEAQLLAAVPAEHRAFADIEFLDGTGALVARIEGYECVIDPALAGAFRNRLLEEARP